MHTWQLTNTVFKCLQHTLAWHTLNVRCLLLCHSEFSCVYCTLLHPPRTNILAYLYILHVLQKCYNISMKAGDHLLIIIILLSLFLFVFHIIFRYVAQLSYRRTSTSRAARDDYLQLHYLHLAPIAKRILPQLAQVRQTKDRR